MDAEHVSSEHNRMDSFYSALRRPGIARSSQGRWFGGVATGLSRWLGLDPLVIRAGFILLSLIFGVGVTVYLLLWLLLPREDGTILLERALRYGDGGAIFLAVITAMSLFDGNPGGQDGFSALRPLVLAAVGGAAWWFLTRTDEGRRLRARARVAPAPAAQEGGGTETLTELDAATPATAPGAPGFPATRMPVPPPVTRPERRAVGFAGGLLVLGSALLVVSVVNRVAAERGWPGNPGVVGLAAGLGLLGLGLVGTGLAGRRAGWLAPFAIVGIGLTLLVALVPAGIRQPWRVGERVVAPTTLQAAAAAYELGVGRLDVNLGTVVLDSDPATTQGLSARLGVGELRIVVPDGQSVEVRAVAHAGGLRAPGGATDGALVDTGGLDHRQTVRFGSGPTQLVIDAEVGLGQIDIRKGATP